MRGTAFSSILFTTLATATAAGQAPAVKGSIRGLVYDSLMKSGPLAGATVELIELSRAVTTDPRGIFRFDSLPGGRYTLSFGHPSLTATGFVPPEQSFDLTAGLDIAVTLTTPSANTIYRRLCPGLREQRTGILLGTVSDATTGNPILAGEVRGEWTETSFTKAGLARRARIVRAGADSLGRYRLCGVPTDVPVLLRVLVAGLDGPPLELKMEDRPLLVRHLTAITDTTAHSQGRLSGRVIAGGRALADAQLLVLGTDKVGRSGTDGSFTMTDLPAGTHTVEARAIGYSRRRLLIDLKATASGDVVFDLARAPVELPELKVTANGLAGQNGFDERRRLNNGGYFITGEDLTRRGTIRVEDAFKGLPGVKVVPAGLNDYFILSTRGGSGFGTDCQFTVFVDDVRIPLDPENGLGIPVTPQDVRGIEVHQGPNSAPIQYQSSGENCGVVLIWTKRGRR